MELTQNNLQALYLIYSTFRVIFNLSASILIKAKTALINSYLRINLRLLRIFVRV